MADVARQFDFSDIDKYAQPAAQGAAHDFSDIDQYATGDPSTIKKPPPPAAPSAWYDPFNREKNPWLSAPTDLLQGVASGAASTAYGINELVRKGAEYLPGSPQVPNIIPKQYTIAPPSIAGDIGHYGEQAAEFLIPATKIGTAGKAIDAAVGLSKTGRLAGLTAKVGLEAIPAYGITLAQTGGDTNAAKNAAITAGALTAALPLVGQVYRYATGATTGAGEYVVNRAMQKPTPELIAAMRGEITEADVLANTRQAVANVAQKRSADYVARLNQLNLNTHINLRSTLQTMDHMLGQFGVQQVANPQTGKMELDFARSHLMLDGAAQQKVRGIYDTLVGFQWRDALSVDHLKRAIDGEYAGSGKASAFVQAVKDELRNTLDKAVPGYQNMTREYAEASDFLNNLTELSTGNKNDGVAIRKLAGALKQNNNYRKDLLEALDAYTSKDLVGQIAGSRLSSYSPRGIMGALTAAGGIEHFFQNPVTHFLSGSVLLGLFGMSPRAVGEAAAKAGVFSRLTKAAGSYLPSALGGDQQPDRGKSVLDQNYAAPQQQPNYGKSVFDRYAYGGEVDSSDDDDVLREIERKRQAGKGNVIQLGAQPGQFYQQPITINPERSKQNLFGDYYDPSKTPPPPAAPTPALPWEMQLQQPRGGKGDIAGGILDATTGGVGQFARGLEQFSEPTGTLKEGAAAGHDIAAGVMGMATPFLMGSGLESPAALARTARTLGGAGAVQHVVQAELESRGVAPEYVSAAGDIAGLVAGSAIHGAPAEEPPPARKAAPTEDAASLVRAQLGIGEPGEATAAQSRQLQPYLEPQTQVAQNYTAEPQTQLATGREEPVVLQDFVASRGGYANPGRLVVRSNRNVTPEEIRASFFPDIPEEQLQIDKIRSDDFMAAGHPGRQPFRLQFRDQYGRAASVPEGIETKFGLQPGEDYHAPPAPLGQKLQQGLQNFWQNEQGSSPVPLAAHVLADYSIAGARKIIGGAQRFSDWSRGMLDDFGQQIQPHLRAIWGEAQHIAGAIGWGAESNQEMPLGNRLTVQAGPVAPDAPVIAQNAVPHLVQRNLDNLNVFHQRNPTMFASNENYIRGMNELFRPRSGRVPIPPDNLIAYSNNTPALGASIDEVSPGQRTLAEEGLQAAGRVRQAYGANSMSPVHTGLYFGWGALSPRQSPYPQESGFLHALDAGLEQWVGMAARGQFDEATLPAYLEWSAQTLRGTPGAQATSNLNSFGRQFLINAGKPVENGPYRGMRTIDALHQIIGDQNLSTIEARRRYQQINNGLGIDNKVFSFIMLVTGHPDTLVADRVRINDFWDAPKLEQQGLSYTTNEQGMMETTRNLYDNGLNQAWNGITGLGMYEAAERSLADRVRQEYANRGINDGTLGRWHWETWLAKSGQEVSHGSLGAIAKMGGQGLTGQQAVVGEGVRQGKYNDLSYGVRYERAPQGFRYNWQKSNGDVVSLTPEQHTQMLQSLREMRDKKQVSGYTEKERIIPYGTKTSESATGPWHDLPGINRSALDRLLDRLSSR